MLGLGCRAPASPHTSGHQQLLILPSPRAQVVLAGAAAFDGPSRAPSMAEAFTFGFARGWSNGTISSDRLSREFIMSATLEELKSTVSGLPAAERAELAHYLLCTLEAPDEGAIAEWLALAERRLDDVRAGRVVGIPADKVMESLRRPRL
jgi:putative addiction module component (TIGR02574 family)